MAKKGRKVSKKEQSTVASGQLLPCTQCKRSFSSRGGLHQHSNNMHKSTMIRNHPTKIVKLPSVRDCRWRCRKTYCFHPRCRVCKEVLFDEEALEWHLKLVHRALSRDEFSNLQARNNPKRQAIRRRSLQHTPHWRQRGPHPSFLPGSTSMTKNRYRSMLKKKEDKSCHERKHRHTLPEKRPKLRWPELESIMAKGKRRAGVGQRLKAYVRKWRLRPRMVLREPDRSEARTKVVATATMQAHLAPRIPTPAGNSMAGTLTKPPLTRPKPFSFSLRDELLLWKHPLLGDNEDADGRECLSTVPHSNASLRIEAPQPVSSFENEHPACSTDLPNHPESLAGESLGSSSVASNRNHDTNTNELVAPVHCETCERTATDPVMTQCRHVFCLKCILDRLTCRGKCPACSKTLFVSLKP
ncbi:unnamed protein product [Somion occarium]|uniref:RING-type domain-containing protein n=1 Tax=Somion occarium TaxID=3059160 RepID=A0ABP1DLZ8_9APHY